MHLHDLQRRVEVRPHTGGAAKASRFRVQVTALYSAFFVLEMRVRGGGADGGFLDPQGTGDATLEVDVENEAPEGFAPDFTECRLKLGPFLQRTAVKNGTGLAGSSTATACASPGESANTANCGEVLGGSAPVGSYPEAASPSGTSARSDASSASRSTAPRVAAARSSSAACLRQARM